MTTIGNIGIGLLLLIIIWIVALIVFVVGVKLQSNISWIVLGSATAVTALLLIIPTDKRHRPVEEANIIEKDYIVIYKNVFFGFMVLSAIVGFISFFVLHCIEPIRAKPIRGSFFQE